MTTHIVLSWRPIGDSGHPTGRWFGAGQNWIGNAVFACTRRRTALATPSPTTRHVIVGKIRLLPHLLWLLRWAPLNICYQYCYEFSKRHKLRLQTFYIMSEHGFIRLISKNIFKLLCFTSKFYIDLFNKWVWVIQTIIHKGINLILK